MQTFHVETRSRTQLIDVTAQVAEAVRAEDLRDGECLVFCPHTTGGITINENADPDVVRDLIMALERVAPPDWPYRHGEGNSDAHLKSTLVGCSERLIVADGELVLGTWQSVYFCEFDGPRRRKLHVQTIGR